MDPATWTLIYYLCAAPAPGVRTLACEARQASAETCELATSHVEAGISGGRRYFPVGCIVLNPAPPPVLSATPRARQPQATR